MTKAGKHIFVITGATASGKSDFAFKLAKKNNGVIINADSMQIYKQIPIISAQPKEKDKTSISHYLYGFVDIFNKEKQYSVGDYILVLESILTNIKSDKTPIIVGGTMLYIDAILHGLSYIPLIRDDVKFEVREKYKHALSDEIFSDLKLIDEKYAKIVDKSNTQRLIRGIEVKLSTGISIVDFWKQKQNSILERYNVEKIIIDVPREELYKKINNRFDKMIENGVIDEAMSVYNYSINNNIDYTKLPKAIGLHEFFNFFNGTISLDEAINKAKQFSRNYAKRQLTWFRNRCVDFRRMTVLNV